MSSSFYHVPLLEPSQKSYSFRLPSSKSLANRVLVLAALSEGTFNIAGDFDAEDIQLMLEALQSLGISITPFEGGVRFKNDLSWMKGDQPLELFLGNSGTCVRFLSSLVPLRSGSTVLTGKQRMTERPIADLVDALLQIGVKVRYLKSDGYPPVQLSPVHHDSSRCRINGSVSSQFITSLMLSAAGYPKGLDISLKGEIISQPYIDLTLDILDKWGVAVDHSTSSYTIPHQTLQGQDFMVEGDASAAVYWWALAQLHGFEVSFSNLERSSKQGDAEFYILLRELSDLEQTERYTVSMNDMPDASLMLMAMAPFYSFPLHITDIGSLRVKETDRISAMANELLRCGVTVEAGRDWMTIHPFDLAIYDSSNPIEIETYDDHRIAMSMAIFGTKLGNLHILDPDCVQKSYPQFWSDLESAY